jgi:hypothetical protein
MRKKLDRAGLGAAILGCVVLAGALPHAGAAQQVDDPGPLADMIATVSDAPDPVARGGDVVYSILVWNRVPDGIVGEDALGAGVFVSVNDGAKVLSIVPPAGGKCVARKGSVAGHLCSIGTIPAKGSATVTAIVRAPKKAGSIGLNADAYSNLVDPAMFNNSDTETTTVR